MWVQKQQSRPPAASVEKHSQAKLSLYDEAPESRVTLEEFESFAVDRLKGVNFLDCLPGNDPFQGMLEGAKGPPTYLLDTVS